MNKLKQDDVFVSFITLPEYADLKAEGSVMATVFAGWIEEIRYLEVNCPSDFVEISNIFFLTPISETSNPVRILPPERRIWSSRWSAILPLPPTGRQALEIKE